MAEFTWEARGRTGELRAGTMVAENAEAVNTRLRKQNLNPVKVKKKPLSINIQVGTGVDTKDLVTFTRLFATMIDAGEKTRAVRFHIDARLRVDPAPEVAFDTILELTTGHTTVKPSG